MKLLRLLVPIIIVASLVPGLAQRASADSATTGDFKITAVTADMGGGTSQEWIEISNVSGHAITGVDLRLRFFNGNCSTLVGDLEFVPRDFAKGEQKGWGASAAQAAGAALDSTGIWLGDQIKTSGTIELTSSNLGVFQDKVAWGTVADSCAEGNAHEPTQLIADHSIVRASRATCASDTNNNNADFSDVTPDVAVLAANNGCDADSDGVGDGKDNCPSIANADQANNDGDGPGDACDADDDNDTFADGNDNCPFVANADQVDSDSDLAGDACDTDDDNDGFLDDAEQCPTVADGTDGCPDFARSITLAYDKPTKTFSGQLDAGAISGCEDGLGVTLYRTYNHRTKPFGPPIVTDVGGAWQLVQAKKTGKFFAQVEVQTVASAGDCGEATSNTLKFK